MTNLGKLIERDLDQRFLNILGRHTDEPATTYTEEAGPPAGALTFQTLAETMKRLRPVEPWITEIWFVDRPAEHLFFISNFPAAELQPPAAPWLPACTFGIDVLNWETRYFNPEREVVLQPGETYEALYLQHGPDKVIWPAVCNVPGVHIRLSNGETKHSPSLQALLQMLAAQTQIARDGGR